MATPLFRRLKTATADLHDIAEKEGPLHRLVDGPPVSVDHYVALLQRLYGFLRAAEPPAVESLRPVMAAESLRGLRRLPDLRRDLAHFGVTPNALEGAPSCGDPPRLDRPSRALGWFYLSEGSRLGGRALAHALAEGLGLGPETGAAYFGSGGENPNQRWHRFQTLAAATLTTPDAERETVAAARDAFARLNRWLADGARPE